MRYLRLFFALFNNSLKRYMEERAGVVGFTLYGLINFLMGIYLVSLMFSHTNSVAGWNKEELFLVLGLSRLFSTLFSLLFQRSINHLTGEIATGGLDLILTKPISAQFYYSFYLIRAFELINLSAPLFLIGYSLTQLSSLLLWPNIFFMFTLLACGTIIFYSIYMAIASLTFWVGKFSSFPSLFNILTNPLFMPTDIYGRGASFFLTFLIPLAFVITIPAKTLLNKAGFEYVLLGILLAGLFLFLSTKLWNEAIKHYSSASS